MSDNVGADAVSQAVMHGHYSFQLVDDDAVLRLVYEFDRRGRRLLSAHLGYYRIARSVEADEIDDARYGAFSDEFEDRDNADDDADAEKTATDVLPLDENEGPADVDIEEAEGAIGDPPDVSWLRIDYDPHQERGPLHAPCHLHFSGFADARLMVHGVPSPSVSTAPGRGGGFLSKDNVTGRVLPRILETAKIKTTRGATHFIRSDTAATRCSTRRACQSRHCNGGSGIRIVR
jgi:hypothetical protein